MTNASRSDRWKRRERAVEIGSQFRTIELFIRCRVRRRLIILVVTQVRSANVFQPILAAIRDDPEHPCIETSAHLGEVLIRLDEAELQNVFSDIRTSRHAQGMTVERIGIPLDQSLERVAIPAEHALNDELISVVLINCALISPQGWLRRLHDNRVTHFPRVGQGVSPAVLLEKIRHVGMTTNRDLR